MNQSPIAAPDFENNEALALAAYADAFAWVKSELQPEKYIVSGVVATVTAPVVAGLMEAKDSGS